MLVIPIQTVNHVKDGLIIILEDIGISRMKEGDPCEVKISELVLKSGKMLLQPDILIAYESEEGMAKVGEHLKNNDIIGLIKYLQRGFKYCPELGDHDRGPEKIANEVNKQCPSVDTAAG